LSGKVAYVAQSAWILNTSVRENILFGLPYDEERYLRVLSVCQLTHDLEMLDAGDMTEIGEKGINLVSLPNI
jgi:ABC-type multidrug transport system fused ATPase/permease subunit